MKTLTGLIYFFAFISYSYGQSMNPIPDNPKRGIYRTYEEFLANSPGIIDSFYVQTKDNVSYNPKRSVNDFKVRKVWGFSDGKKVYIGQQNYFFPLEYVDNELRFIGYDIINYSGAVAAGALGGAIGAGIYTAIEISTSKNQQKRYIFDVFDSTIYDEGYLYRIQNKDLKVILYRKGKDEADTPINVKVNDGRIYNFIPNSYEEIIVKISREPLTICYGEDLNTCIKISTNSTDTKYIECSISKKESSLKVEEVKKEVGEFYANKAKYFQDKRLR